VNVTHAASRHISRQERPGAETHAFVLNEARTVVLRPGSLYSDECVVARRSFEVRHRLLRALSSGVSQGDWQKGELRAAPTGPRRSRRAGLARSCYHAQPLPVVQIDRAGCPARRHIKRWPPVGAYSRIILGHTVHHLPDRRFIRSVRSAHVLGVPAYASTVTSFPIACAMHLYACSKALTLPIVA
jgi:hypothetical protein